MHIHRLIEPAFKRAMRSYPVVTLIGPRQSGKTTLAQSLAPSKTYVNLEEPDIRERILADPRAFFAEHKKGVILDEVQRAPTLLSYIQTIVDKAKKPGMFVLTGSHQLQLHEALSQSLAGRTALLELWPFSFEELAQQRLAKTPDYYMLRGFYPAVYSRRLNATDAYRNYVKTYVERDVRQLVNVRDLQSFQRAVQLLAAHIGGMLNTERLSGDVGVTANTLKQWISTLEASYLIYRLPPYFENFGKRIVKAHKLYFSDVGLASYVLGFEEEKQITRDRLRGILFENLVVMELVKARANQGKEPRMFYFRDNHGYEVDVVLAEGTRLVPIEIKASATFSTSMLDNIRFFKNLVGKRVTKSFLIYTGEEEHVVDGVQLLNYRNAHRILEA